MSVSRVWTTSRKSKNQASGQSIIKYYNYWDLNLYQSALPSIHVWVIKEKFVILYTEFKWRKGVHFGQNAAKNNDLLKKRFE